MPTDSFVFLKKKIYSSVCVRGGGGYLRHFRIVCSKLHCQIKCQCILLNIHSIYLKNRYYTVHIKNKYNIALYTRSVNQCVVQLLNISKVRNANI